MKLLLIGLDGVRVDLALPEVVAADEGFAVPDHPADPRFAAAPRDVPRDAPRERGEGTTGRLAPTLSRLAAGGRVVPVWMTPPTDSGPGWASLLTGTTHEENNVWWNEFVGHRLARCPDLLSRVFFADPRARTFAATTWPALVAATGPGPVVHSRPDQQVGGQHQLFAATDFSDGCRSADRQVRTRAAWVLNHEGPDAAFVHLEGPDEAAHRHGSQGPEYRAALTAADEDVRHLVKAVAERFERLGEDWLVAVTTDHGHKPEGGHGEDEVVVRRSFLLVHRIGGPLPAGLREPATLRSHEVSPLLLAAVGVRPGSLVADHPVGQVRDVPSAGPTRDLRHEW
ncbi:alkaline phosphatase family protein [Kineococcus rhizosphaerae]|uniref:Type I phosphodiesterase/nucleotide pyrophosphatase n=1 Tax=Kineococcus rhizosphaerae TaxID=559628 RepID=A0A2T0R3G0_9ACTN|nr:alkaline phosphatase family protein [Kineococcus rhizosphaerae]PRY14597.1 type I phosphodiesterase/nucleotide pyrophosphatase [Kineococcus rhizosphaerae]